MTGAPVEVTIGMPILDNARTVQRAIDSVSAQSFGGWRLIISDDGSSDASVQIAEAAAARDDRISLIRQEVRQGVMNFRVPLEQATSPYFVWLAGDDYWHPDFLTHTVQALNAAPAAVSALPRGTFVGPPERPIPNLDFLQGSAAGRIRDYLAQPGGTRMYGLMRTKLLKSVFPQRTFHAYDWYFMIRLLAEGPQLSLPQTLIFREETPWWRYAADHASKHPTGLVRSVPLLHLSWQLVRDRSLPMGAVPALIRLNLRKHAEIEALTQADRFRRRLWLYRRLGLPIARNPRLQAEIAAHAVPAGAGTLAKACQPGLAVDVTAILTFRNAARTLGRAIDHLHALGCQIVAIDHGSTDGSGDIARSRLGGQVQRLIDEPWTGTFDLQRQLRQKAGLIGTRATGWVLHADADEFLDPPDGETLATCIAQAEANGRIAFSCDEDLYTPRYEDEEHDAGSFLQTMTDRVRMQERDVKQRLFRRDADLALWFRTGGHSVTRDVARLAETRLTLRHYPGLSLDDLRGQYLSRVVSPDDRARLWHGNRLAAKGFDIVEPDPALFGRATPVMTKRLPFLQEWSPGQASRLSEPADLYLLSDRTDATLAKRIGAILHDLRVVECDVADLVRMARMVPVLQVLSHPARLHGPGVQRSQERSRATSWTRQVAMARQWALDRGAVYCEVRAEDLAANPDASLDRLVRLWRPPVLRGAAGFLAPDAPPVRVGPWENPVLAITGPLAADLGYR